MNARLAFAATVFTATFAAAADDHGSLSKDDVKFIQDAARAGMAEVNAARLAKEKADGQEVKDFARHMEEDHTKANEELEKLAKSKGLQLPGDVDRKHHRMMDELRSHTTAQFEREYMKQQVSDHKGVIRDFDRESKHGRDADLRKWAADKLPTLRGHLKMAEDTTKGLKLEKSPVTKQPKGDPSGSMTK